MSVRAGGPRRLGRCASSTSAGGGASGHVSGDGPAIVFVHGALVNANLWRKVVPRLDGFTQVRSTSRSARTSSRCRATPT